MAMYIKVTPRVAQVLGKGTERVKTKDGNVLLWQADLNGISGNTIFDRAAAVGGAALTAQQAKAETDGVGNPISVYTPTIYQEISETSATTGTSTEEDSDVASSNINDGGIENE